MIYWPEIPFTLIQKLSLESCLPNAIVFLPHNGAIRPSHTLSPVRFKISFSCSIMLQLQPSLCFPDLYWKWSWYCTIFIPAWLLVRKPQHFITNHFNPESLRVSVPSFSFTLGLSLPVPRIFYAGPVYLTNLDSTFLISRLLQPLSSDLWKYNNPLSICLSLLKLGSVAYDHWSCTD